MTDCWPPCSPWCECVDGHCQARPTTINALRFTTPDGRSLRVAQNTGKMLVAQTIATPGFPETFLLGQGKTGPLNSGDSLELLGCGDTFAPSGDKVRVDHTTLVLPSSRRDQPPLVTYEIGGTGAAIFVREPFPDGYPAYKGDRDESEWTFDIVKVGGGPIVDGDQVSLRINSNRGRTFFFRVTGAQEGAGVDGDGAFPGAPGTLFTVRLNEVIAGVGWRPAVVDCQSCAGVVGLIRDRATKAPIAGARVEALDVLESHPFSGTSDNRSGRFSLVDPEGRTCIPYGTIRLQTTEDRHQTSTISVTVAAQPAGGVNVTIDLDCTNVSGVVVDQVGRPVAGVVVALLNSHHEPVLDANEMPLLATTGANGEFVFRCVPHGTVFLEVMNARGRRPPVVVPPEGVAGIKIVTQTICGNLIGSVKDASTLAPIANATVVIIGGATSMPVRTNANGEFKIACVRPAGQVWIMVSAPGYSASAAFGTVPMSGNSAPVDVLLTRLQVTRFLARLDWGMLPGDLDLRMKGPDGMGGEFEVLWAFPNPVSFASLDQDVQTGFGPETITVSPSPLGTFFAGTYKIFVFNVANSHVTVADYDVSHAAVSLMTDGPSGLTQIAHFEVMNAAGMQNLPFWYVCDLVVAANGTTITVNPVQQLQSTSP